MCFYTAKTCFVVSDSPFTDFSDFFKDLIRLRYLNNTGFVERNEALMCFYTAKTRFLVSDSPFKDFSDFFKDLMGSEIFKQYRFVEKIKL